MAENSKIELKPCPFCGGAAGTYEASGGQAGFCDECDILMLAAQWNTRAPDPIGAAWMRELAANVQVIGTIGMVGLSERVQHAIRAIPLPTDDGFADLCCDALREAQKAQRKFPQPNKVLLKVAEEAGEVVKAAIHFGEGRETRENVRGEMVQTIAMLYRLWIEGDEVNGIPAIAGDANG